MFDYIYNDLKTAWKCIFKKTILTKKIDEEEYLKYLEPYF